VRAALLISALAAAGLASWPGVSPWVAELGGHDAAQDAQAGRGGRVYAAECASCHGAAGEGQPAGLLKRKSPKLAAVALANRMARIAWKPMLSGEAYTATPAPATLAGAA